MGPSEFCGSSLGVHNRENDTRELREERPKTSQAGEGKEGQQLGQLSFGGSQLFFVPVLN